MNNTETPTTIQIGDIVRVPNGEKAQVSDVFRKDGENRLTVDFEDDTWIDISPDDVTVL